MSKKNMYKPKIEIVRGTLKTKEFRFADFLACCGVSLSVLKSKRRNEELTSIRDAAIIWMALEGRNLAEISIFFERANHTTSYRTIVKIAERIILNINDPSIKKLRRIDRIVCARDFVPDVRDEKGIDFNYAISMQIAETYFAINGNKQLYINH